MYLQERALTPWYHAGSAKGTRSPNGSSGPRGWAVGASVVEDAGTGAGAGAGAGAGGGRGGAAAFFVSKEPICSFPLYFFRIPSLWYFQNCFEASFPATRCKTVIGTMSIQGVLVWQ